MHYKTNISNILKDVELRQDPVIITVNEFTEEAAREFQAAMCAGHNSGQSIIPIQIDSYGGDVYALMSMVSSIKNSELPVATIIQGKAMSCGAILASLGTKGHRYMDPDATIMIHDVSSLSYGKIEDLKSSVRETERLQQKVFEMMSENCGKEKNYFTDLIHSKGRADWFLEAEEAINHGLVDHVRVPTLHIDITASIDLK